MYKQARTSLHELELELPLEERRLWFCRLVGFLTLEEEVGSEEGLGGHFTPAAPERQPLLVPSPCPLLRLPAGAEWAELSSTRGRGLWAPLQESLLSAATMGSRSPGRGCLCRHRPDRQ